MTLIEKIIALCPCHDAREWLLSIPDELTPEQVWCDCGRGDWMLWLCDRIGIERVLLVRSACQIARSVLHLVPTGEDRPRLAIEAAEAWCDAPSAAAASSASYTAETEAAAETAAYTAYTAETAAESAAAWAAASASAATWAAAESAAASASASVEARAASLRASADLVRYTIPWELVEAACTAAVAEIQRRMDDRMAVL